MNYQVAGRDYSATDSEVVTTSAGSGNSPPTAVAPDVFGVDENLPNAVIGDITVTDSDPSDTHTLTVADPRFEFVGTTLRLAAGVSLDFEVEPTVILSITATDPAGAMFTQDVTIQVGDVNEQPLLSLAGSTVTANSPGARVGTLSVADPDQGDVHTFVVDNPRFEVVGSDLKLVDGDALALGETETVTITVQDSGGLTDQVVVDVTGVPPGSGSGTNSSISVLGLDPNNGQSLPVSVGQCIDAGGGTITLNDPVILGSGSVALPGNVALTAQGLIKTGDAIFVQVLDPDANQDAGLVERVEVVLSGAGSDVEQIVLTETGVDTGIFTGYVQSELATVTPGDCRFQASADESLLVTYTDPSDATDTASVTVVVDPVSVVFDSASGRPIVGAVITLQDTVSGTPATVFADDGVTPISATLTSGDAGLPGTYRFAFVAPGNYQLLVTPPNRFAFPSVTPDAVLQGLPGAPFSLSGGSRGQIFSVGPNPVFAADIPLDLQPIVPTASQMNVSAASPTGIATTVQPSACFDGTGFIPAAVPSTIASGAIAVPGQVMLDQANRFSRGDAIFIQLVDPDQDLDPFAPDMVEITVTVQGQLDRERIQLLETDASTGVFSGYLQSTVDATATANNCQLEATPASTVQLTYADASDPQDVNQQDILLDPGFTVFSSATGDFLNGATVSLIDVATGQLATGMVFAEDGTTAFPAVVTSGGTVTDGNGQTYQFGQGSIYFPVIAPGTYRLQVEPPPSYLYPTTRSDADLTNLPGGPFVLQSGSRGGDFTVTAGQPFGFDLPLDPIDATVFVSKQANKDVVAVGDFLQYRVLVQNQDSAGQVSDLQLVDVLPGGFRLQEESLTVNDQPAEGTLDSSGQQFQVAIGDLPTGAQVEVKYVLEVGAGSALGVARNAASVSGTGVAQANVAFADVLVREDLFRSRATILGTVWEGDCQDQQSGQQRNATEHPQGMPNTRIWLEDGSFVVTDAQGKFHFAGVKPGTHVLQLDTTTLPSSHEVIACESSSRFAGASTSQFVDVTGGSLWQADFYVRKKPDTSAELVTRLDAQARAEDGLVEYRYHIIGQAMDLGAIKATLSLDEHLEYVKGSTRLNGLPKGDPKDYGAGMLGFRLPTSAEAFAYELQFSARILSDKPVQSKAVVQLENTSGRYRSDKVTNTLSFNWPASLFQVAESDRDLPDVKKANSAANAQALARAQETNSRAMQGSADGGVTVQSRVFEPTQGKPKSRSNTVRTPVQVRTEAVDIAPYTLPELDRGEAPPFDLTWLERHAQEGSPMGIAWPPPRYNPVMPAIAVAVVHPSDQRPVLLVDGELVSALSFEGVTRHAELGLSVTLWDNVAISERDSLLTAQIQDQEGNTLSVSEQQIHYSGRPVRAELVTNESYLVADGVYPPVVAVRLFDRAGYPLRAGTTGDFSVVPPYQPLDKTRHLESSASSFVNNKYKVLQDGIAYIQLEPTITTGEAVLQFQFDQVRNETIRARLIPGARDWVMIGLVEGSYSSQDLSGNLSGLDSAGLGDDTLTDGRVAFYAKGMVPGKWLLSVAYDTAKDFERTLQDQIDPNQFYTLYGDGTQQIHAAQSQQKLYLKLEKSRFGVLFGDYHTQFQRSELTRYERRLNGIEAGYFGDKIEAYVFGADTDQAFVRDELRGDGTSGVYRLSRNRIVRNSEQIRIVTRDRFALETILEQQTLQRFLDYTIDFDRGTIIFKQPVLSQDNQFNPVFIEVEYEVAADAEKEVVAGARVAYRLDNQDSEIALAHVTDEAAGVGGDLTGVDLTWQITQANKVTAEFARSDTQAEGEADAALLQLEHRSADFAGRIYFRELQPGFGLGHQSTLDAGTRKIGLEGEYRLGEHLTLRGVAFDQTLLDFGSERQVADVLAEWQLSNGKIRAGARAVQEESLSGLSRDATQILLGGTYPLLNGRLVLRADAEVDTSDAENTDYPSRGVVGLEYDLWRDVKLIAEQELTWGSERDTQDTLIGFKARPWTGADVHTTLNRAQGEQGSRLFATTGLIQQWQLNDRWMLDAGMDRVATLNSDGDLDEPADLLFNPAQPPGSGSFEQDFDAVFAGATYRSEHWSATSRLELHQGDVADKWNLLLGANRQLSEGRVVSLSTAITQEERADATLANTLDMRLGLAWRPAQSSWAFLNRADLQFSENRSVEFDSTARKLVNNFNANYRRQGHQLSLQLGFKYVVDDIDDTEYDATTLLYGVAYRLNLGPRWDAGLAASILQSTNSGSLEESYGASVGFNVFRNAWVSVGYNFTGFKDDDFVAADYTAQGPFLKVRMKLDEELAQRFLAFTGLSNRRNQIANSR